MSVSQTIKENSKSTLNEAEYQAGRVRKHLAEYSGEKADELASEAKNRASDFTSSIKRAANASAKSLREDGYPGVGGFIESVTERMEYVDDAIDGTSAASIGHKVQGFVRDKPLVVFGGLALLGFLAGSALQVANPQSRTVAQRTPRQPGSQTSGTRSPGATSGPVHGAAK